MSSASSISEWLHDLPKVATDLITELTIGSDLFGLDRDAHRAMQLDAVRASFMPRPARSAVASEIASY